MHAYVLSQPDFFWHSLIITYDYITHWIFLNAHHSYFYDLRTGGTGAIVDVHMLVSCPIDDADREVPPADDRKDAST